MDAENNNQIQKKNTGTPFLKGQSGNPNGRPQGVPNKATGLAREAIARFVDENSHRLTEWLDQMAKENPEAAFRAFMSVVEYHIPKLQRLEQKTEVDNRTQINIIRFSDLSTKLSCGDPDSNAIS